MSSFGLEYARSRFAHNLLQPFDISAEEREFFHSGLISGTVSSFDFRWILGVSLVAGAESWDATVECARAHQRTYGHLHNDLRGTDDLAFLWQIFQGQPPCSKNHLGSQPSWGETDRLIALAQAQAEQNSPPESHVSQTKTAAPAASPLRPASRNSTSSKRSKKRKRRDLKSQRKKGIHDESSISHFWTWEPASPPLLSSLSTRRGTWKPPPMASNIDAGACNNLAGPCTTSPSSREGGTDVKIDNASTSRLPATAPGGKSTAQSPFFAEPTAPPKLKSPNKRPPRGTVSCVPFPSLHASQFGLIQEKVADSSFWLLIVVTFLIRTKGKDAVPVFYKIRERFPSPAHLVDPANADEILSMIRHLGLGMNRLGMLQKYARLFIESPPQPGKVYRVKNYDRRDVSSPPRHIISDTGSPRSSHDDSSQMIQVQDSKGDAEAWEIGHMTQGKYAIDSWRIFCRDVLLGRAQGWNGQGREPEFQPEWMRVRPDDKELRACLRWVWMREGWEWDPTTGERTVLREELRLAVNERRVEYDDNGALRIIADPRPLP